MRSTRARWVGMWLFVCAAACSSPTEPVPPGYAGEWSGTTSQDRSLSFSVSGDQVTSFTLAFNSPPTCSGTETLTGPKPIILREDNQQGFAMGKTGEDFGWGIALYGVFSEDRRSASGEIQLVQYPGCGTLNIKWTAKRR